MTYNSLFGGCVRRNASFLLWLSLTVPLFPATIVVDPNPVLVAQSINPNVTGADLAGLTVDATYETPGAPTTVKSTWAATGPTSGAASTATVSVSVDGSASGVLAWHYSSIFISPLISLDFDGSAAEIYFDRAHSGPGTPGSGSGADLSFGPLFPNGIDSLAVVTYSSAVSLNGDAPQNDLYAKLSLNFAALPMGGLEPQDFAFTQPTDTNSASSASPEPSSLPSVVAGAALFFFVFIGRSKRDRRLA